MIGNGRTNAGIEFAIENIVDGAGRATHDEGSNQELEKFSPEGLQVQTRVVGSQSEPPRYFWQ